jgi:hypothetical protein
METVRIEFEPFLSEGARGFIVEGVDNYSAQRKKGGPEVRLSRSWIGIRCLATRKTLVRRLSVFASISGRGPRRKLWRLAVPITDPLRLVCGFRWVVGELRCGGSGSSKMGRGDARGSGGETDRESECDLGEHRLSPESE